MGVLSLALARVCASEAAVTCAIFMKHLVRQREKERREGRGGGREGGNTSPTRWLSGQEPACRCRRLARSLGGENPAGGSGIRSSLLAWRIPWTEEPGGYSPWGGLESDTTGHTRKEEPSPHPPPRIRDWALSRSRALILSGSHVLKVASLKVGAEIRRHRSF